MTINRVAKFQSGVGSLPRDCFVTDLSESGVRLYAEGVPVERRGAAADEVVAAEEAVPEEAVAGAPQGRAGTFSVAPRMSSASGLMPLAAASQRRWLRALRPGCT